MAVMRPEVLPEWVVSDPKLSAEAKVYDVLRALPDGYRVYYHVPWVNESTERGPASEGEADFIVAHPDKGILLIEVKGGRIGHDGPAGGWTTTDREGKVHRIDPFKQISRCRYALIDKMKACPLWRGEWLEIGHAVCFPHCSNARGFSTADAPPAIIIGGDDLANIDAKIEEIYTFWRQSNAVRPPGPAGIALLEAVAAPTFVLKSLDRAQALAAQEERIITLTREQFSAFELLQQIPRVTVQGGAGTGKTLLAVEKARRAAALGRRTLLICYNRPLADHMRSLLSPAPDGRFAYARSINCVRGRLSGRVCP